MIRYTSIPQNSRVIQDQKPLAPLQSRHTMHLRELCSLRERKRKSGLIEVRLEQTLLRPPFCYYPWCTRHRIEGTNQDTDDHEGITIREQSRMHWKPNSRNTADERKQNPSRKPGEVRRPYRNAIPKTTRRYKRMRRVSD